MAGRRSVFTTPAQLDEMARLRRTGSRPSVIADSLGILRKTLYHAIAQGEAAEACEVRRCLDPHHGPRGPVKYVDISRALRQAKGQAGARANAIIHSSFERHPRLAERFLEREYPEDYGPPPSRAALERSERQDRSKQEIKTTGAPLVIQLVPNDRPQEEIDAFMAEVRPTQAPPEIEAGEAAVGEAEEAVEDDEEDADVGDPDGDWIDERGRIIPGPASRDREEDEE